MPKSMRGTEIDKVEPASQGGARVTRQSLSELGRAPEPYRLQPIKTPRQMIQRAPV